VFQQVKVKGADQVIGQATQHLLILEDENNNAVVVNADRYEILL
jgi:PHD/YefM family antitoxin component YafN of YafNO toxin-antitoxin module